VTSCVIVAQDKRLKSWSLNYGRARYVSFSLWLRQSLTQIQKQYVFTDTVNWPTSLRLEPTMRIETNPHKHQVKARAQAQSFPETLVPCDTCQSVGLPFELRSAKKKRPDGGYGLLMVQLIVGQLISRQPCPMVIPKPTLEAGNGSSNRKNIVQAQQICSRSLACSRLLRLLPAASNQIDMMDLS